MRSVGTRFLIPFGILAVLSSVFIFYQTYESSREHAYELISQQAAMAQEFNLAIRDYTAQKIRPLMEKFIDKDTFIPETMSTSFVSRSIFEKVQKKVPGFVIRFSSDNPRNPINTATPDEQRMMTYFRQNPRVKRRTEEIQIDGKHYLAHFAPMLLKPDCLQCHSEPQAARAGLIKRYGALGGFHRKLGDVVGLDTIAVPVEAINASLDSEMLSRSLVLAAVLALLFGSIFLIFRFVVTRRLVAMASHFDEIAAHAESPWMTPVEVKGNDEISVVGIAFNKLVEQLRATHASLEQRVGERTEELQHANTQLALELTEREKAEEALRKSEEKYRLLFDHAFDAVVAIDMPGARVIDVNEAFIKLYGYTKEEAICMTATDLSVEPDKSSHTLQAALAMGGAYVPLHWHRKKDGTAFPVELSAGLLKLHDREVVCVFIKDITERQRVETERLQLSKLESLGTLAGGIAHDFNNILTTILANIGLAMLDGKLNKSGRERLRDAEQACLKAEDLSGQLLTFAKGGTPIKKVTSLVKLVRESAKLALAGSNSRCEFSLPENLWSVEVDQGQIGQVINNLLINANQAMSGGGVIRIAAENLLLAEGSDLTLSAGQYVKLLIADQGIGIPGKYLDKIFDPYFTTKQNGSGLGLATAYSIIKKHSGHIKVASELEAGTTFEIYLPAQEEVPLASLKQSETLTVGHGKVLVMDDDQKIREVLCRMLGKLGYQADSASDGSQAIERFVRAKESGQMFDTVILDLTVPGGMGGKETVEELRKIDPQIKAIVSSGYSEDPIMANFAEYGFSAVIAKPYTVVELSKILQEVLNTGRN